MRKLILICFLLLVPVNCFADAIKFSKVGVTNLILTYSPPKYRQREVFSSVALETTAGNQTYAYSKGIKYILYTLEWGGESKGQPLNKGEYDGNFNWTTFVQTTSTQSLANWFYNIAQGGLNTFTFYDESGNSHVVRIVNETLGFIQTENGSWNGKLTLKEEL